MTIRYEANPPKILSDVPTQMNQLQNLLKKLKLFQKIVMPYILPKMY